MLQFFTTSKKVVCCFTSFFLSVSIISAQLPTNCFEIESILVDACGSPEGENEMVRFIVGNTSLNTANMSVSWANTSNPWLGICQNATTANVVSTLNNTISSCGLLIEPVGGVLPVGANVLLITSTAIDVNANSFANLSDTLHVIFQCPGNTSGHFANWNTTAGLRTLTINFSSPANCSDQVTYDRTVLVNQNGLIGGNSSIRDGALANFNWTGNASYDNFGCQAPFIPSGISIQPITPTSICKGDSIQLYVIKNGIIDSLQWTGNNGTFNSTNLDSITYYSSTNDTANFYIYIEGISPCGKIKDSVLVQINPPVIFTQTPSICLGQIFILPLGGQVSIAGTYSDTLLGVASTGCDSIIITQLTIIQATSGIQNVSICQGQTFTLPGGVVVSNAGSYSDTLIGASATGCDSIIITNLTILNTNTVSIIENDTSICISDFLVLHGVGNNLIWSNGAVGIDSIVVSEHGTYTLSSTINGCISQDQITISIIECIIPEIIIPNVFTPNGDNINDIFKIKGTFISEVSGIILNRWGQKLYNWNGVDGGWDGKHEGKIVPNGTYFYILKVSFTNNEEKVIKGNVTLFY